MLVCTLNCLQPYTKYIKYLILGQNLHGQKLSGQIFLPKPQEDKKKQKKQLPQMKTHRGQNSFDQKQNHIKIIMLNKTLPYHNLAIVIF